MPAISFTEQLVFLPLISTPSVQPPENDDTAPDPEPEPTAEPEPEPTAEPEPEPTAEPEPPEHDDAAPIPDQPDEAPEPAEGFFVAPDGTASGDGSQDNPWNLETALAQPETVQPGATIWLRGGTYSGTFRSELAGTEAAPITVRQYPGERAIIDGSSGDAPAVLLVEGEWTIYQGFEVTNSDPQRVIDRDAPDRGTGVNVVGTNTKFINMVVHDNGNGFGFRTASASSEIYGSIIYNNGWQSTDRGHGHGIYAQNEAGTKRIVDNILFNQFGYGIHAYGSDRAFLRGFQIEGNISFNNGAVSEARATPNMLVGGGTPAERVDVAYNYTYHSNADTSNVRMGYGDTRSTDLRFTDNYLAGGARVLTLHQWEEATVTNNTLVGAGLLANLPVSSGSDAADYAWNNNTYYYTSDGYSFYLRDDLIDFAEWRQNTGVDADSQFFTTRPDETVVFVRPNQYEAGRAHIVVYNWAGDDTVEVDVSQVMGNGDAYKVYNVQDYFGTPVVSGTYSGEPLRLPLTGTAPPQPVGEWAEEPPVTGPEFDVFVVVSTNS